MQFDLEPNQINTVEFVMIDVNGIEVAGLGATFTLELSKHGGTFQASAGTKEEIGHGWYRYTTTAGECDTRGPLSIRVNGAGCLQQNLPCVVSGRNAAAIEFTYTVTDVGTGNPIEGADVWIATDISGSNVLWRGVTDALGVARDVNGELPWLDAGTYYFWSQKSGYTFINPDTEVVS